MGSCCAAHTLRGATHPLLNTDHGTPDTKKTPHAPARARLPLLRFRPGGVGLDGATWGAANQSSGSVWEAVHNGTSGVR